MILELRSLSKTYPGAAQPALNGVSIGVPEGQFLVILGPSGAGKSSLMRCINRLVEPTSGRVVLEGEAISRLSRRALRRARRKIGMIFQEFALVERLTVMETVWQAIAINHLAGQEAIGPPAGPQITRQ